MNKRLKIAYRLSRNIYETMDGFNRWYWYSRVNQSEVYRFGAKDRYEVTSGRIGELAFSCLEDSVLLAIEDVKGYAFRLLGDYKISPLEFINFPLSIKDAPTVEDRQARHKTREEMSVKFLEYSFDRLPLPLASCFDLVNMVPFAASEEDYSENGLFAFAAPVEKTIQSIHFFRKYIENILSRPKLMNNRALKFACEAKGIPYPRMDIGWSVLAVPDLIPLPWEASSDENFFEELETATENSNGFQSIVTKYSVDNFSNLMVATLMQIFSNKLPINKCGNCGKYFVPMNRSDTVYCDRTSPQDEEMTCKEYGSKKLWYENLQNDEAMKLARKVYMAKQMRKKRYPDIEEYAIAFETFKKESANWKKAVKSGEKTSNDFIEWLKVEQGRRTP